jgi:hypothetical protein
MGMDIAAVKEEVMSDQRERVLCRRAVAESDQLSEIDRWIEGRELYPDEAEVMSGESGLEGRFIIAGREEFGHQRSVERRDALRRGGKRREGGGLDGDKVGAGFIGEGEGAEIGGPGFEDDGVPRLCFVQRRLEISARWNRQGRSLCLIGYGRYKNEYD